MLPLRARSDKLIGNPILGAGSLRKVHVPLSEDKPSRAQVIEFQAFPL